MEKNTESKTSVYPEGRVTYSQSVEEMKELIQNLKNYMTPCPNEDLTFNLVETIDYYNLRRNFKIKSKSSLSKEDELNKFKDNLMIDISTLESFTNIPTINSIEIETQSSKGKLFKSPKIYDINGDETSIIGKECVIFLYDNINDLSLFVNRNKTSNSIIHCLGINMNFFETKKWIKNNGLLNNRNFIFCFSDISTKSLNSVTNLKIGRLPRVASIGADGIVREDKFVNNLNMFDLQRDLINYTGKREYNSEELAKTEKYIYLENETKRNLVKSMNIFLRKNGLNNVHFYVKSKICIDKKGIKKIRCYPVFYGEAKEEGRNIITNLISNLSEQQLFYDIQCKVIYSK